ncbi:hypothetical protein X798_02031 [Onchocerca flexuosa]|uniref:Uncharacterized protein n=1 Tax=Onchocerca flexuosa TaxID=387005 RepID=A0A238C066_9BILA|nr:hypothetical protein X798_02031 [Onchocerca flexuosa]
MGYNEIIRKSGHQNYPQNMIHTFDTEHLCQAQCHVPCSMKHISDLMMQRWLCPLKEKNEWNSAPSEDRFLAGFTTIMATVICLAVFGVFLLICITCLIRIHCCRCRRSDDA